MRLRRTLVGGAEGELFPDDGATLKRAGVQAHMLIIIEYGEPPDATNITVKVKLIGRSACVFFDTTWTVHMGHCERPKVAGRDEQFVCGDVDEIARPQAEADD